MFGPQPGRLVRLSGYRHESTPQGRPALLPAPRLAGFCRRPWAGQGRILPKALSAQRPKRGPTTPQSISTAPELRSPLWAAAGGTAPAAAWTPGEERARSLRVVGGDHTVTLDTPAIRWRGSWGLAQKNVERAADEDAVDRPATGGGQR